MFLEIATTVGALVGAKLVLHLHVSVISIIFGVVLLYSAYASITQHAHSSADGGPDRIATWLKMDSTYPTANGMESYHVRGVSQGFVLMFVAGGGFCLLWGVFGAAEGEGMGRWRERAVPNSYSTFSFHTTSVAPY